MDSNQCVCLFKKDYLQGDTTKPIEWQFHGKRRTHEIEITSIGFGESLDENEQTKLRLFSIGRDRRIVEYDVYASSQQKGLEVMTMFKIEKEAHPTACIWYPKVDTKEDLLLTANDDYKMKIWNVSTKNSRRTCLGPTYGGEITKLKRLDIDNNADKYLIYSTKKTLIGVKGLSEPKVDKILEAGIDYNFIYHLKPLSCVQSGSNHLTYIYRRG